MINVGFISAEFVFVPQILAIGGKRFVERNVAPAFAGYQIAKPLVKQLVEKQNGRISVKSEQGEGTTFTIYFPLAN